MFEAEIEVVTQRIWGDIPAPTCFPRDPLAHAIRNLPLAPRPLSKLTPEKIDAWLASRQSVIRLACEERDLHGAVCAQRGRGVLFFDAADPPNERRFTGAHELGHFLCDYLLPRERALAALGEAIRPVLDGDRPPTPQEHVSALLSGVPLGSYVSLMARDNRGLIADNRITLSEIRADRFALHLLAPWHEVRACLAQRPTEANRAVWTHDAQAALLFDFGLPEWIAGDYAAALWHAHQTPDTRAWLGL